MLDYFISSLYSRLHSHNFEEEDSLSVIFYIARPQENSYGSSDLPY